VTLTDELAALVGRDNVLPGTSAAYLTDQTESRNLRGRADAIALPGSTDEVAAVLAWCYDHDTAVIPRGGGTGYAGGCVPVDGGVVLALDRLNRVRTFDPLLWRMEVEAGVTTGEVRRRARENGLLFPPDPGGAEQSHIGGNIAANAGGPHAFKYGVTGAWVTGLEAVVPPGDVVRVGGAIRKDVAGYDLKSLLIGSEGTLGIVTAAWLRLIPAPEAALPVVALFGSVADGCEAIEAVVGRGLVVAALEYLDGGALAAAPPPFAGGVEAARFAVLAEADGSEAETAALRRELRELFAGTALAVHAPEAPADIAALWRWRDGLTFAVTAQRGGKVSEDIVVPLDRLCEAVEETVAIGTAHGLAACSWGHAGDGNLHSTFLVDRRDAGELEAAERAAEELFALAARLGGSISGEHGVGLVKRGQLGRVWAPRALEIHAGIKQLFDPKNLLNPGKKL
jgi:glycolate oxidase subunit GlcD